MYDNKLHTLVTLQRLAWGLFALSSFLFATTAVAGDAARGKELTAICAACHGGTGISSGALFPSLAGQGERYLVEQLTAMRDGERFVPEMAGQLDGMSATDLADIAAYYAAQQNSPGQADPKLVALGERIYRAGIAEKGVAACMGCHGPEGTGLALAGFPHLSGQVPEYLVKSLMAYQAGERRAGPSSEMMRTIALRLTPAEMRAVASYINGLY